MPVGTRRAPLKKWLGFLRLAAKTRLHLFFHRYDVIVSAFPQGSLAMGLVNMLTFNRTPHIAWYFNCGHEYRGARRWLSRIVFKRVRKFVVYSQYERDAYSRTFALPKDRFHFAYLTGQPLIKSEFADVRQRFSLPDRYIVSAGSSGREYATLFNAVRNLPIATVIIAHDFALAGLQAPPNVIIFRDISQHDYLGILMGAKLCVLPIDNVETASGQMTLIQAMTLGVPVVATRCIGTEDYITDGVTGLFVERSDAEGLAATLKQLLSDHAALERMAAAAEEFAARHFGDRAGAQTLEELIRMLDGVRSEPASSTTRR